MLNPKAYIFQTFSKDIEKILDGVESRLDCPSSKGNQAPHPKFERPNGNDTKSKTFFKSVKNWCLQLT